VIQEFYDQMSPFYHLIFEDWEASIEKQTKIIDQIIRTEWGTNHKTVIDISCGIGTQARGHQEAETKVFRSKYYAISTSKIIELMEMAGFSSVKKKESEFYQPVIIGTKKI
jgi:hypothetical protein